MNHGNRQQTWSDYVKSLEKLHAGARKIQEILDENPELAKALIASFQQAPDLTPEGAHTPVVAPPTPSLGAEEDDAVPATPHPSSATKKKKLREKVIDILVQRKNEPFGAPTLARELGIKRGTLTNMLYAYEKKDFEKIDHPKGGGKVLWKLRHWPLRDKADGGGKN